MKRCRNCGERIVLADDGSRWLHVVGYTWSVSCGLVAEPEDPLYNDANM